MYALSGIRTRDPSNDQPHTCALGRAGTGFVLLKSQALRDVIFTNSEIEERKEIHTLDNSWCLN